jgi:hypothetical protein
MGPAKDTLSDQLIKRALSKQLTDRSFTLLIIVRTLISTTGRDLIFSSVFQEENVIQLQIRGTAACCRLSTPGQ